MPSPLFPRFNRSQQTPNQPGSLANAPKQGLTSWLRAKIGNAVRKQLGKTGDLIQALLRPSGQSLTEDVQQEIDAAAEILAQIGNQRPQRVQEAVPARPQYRVGANPEPDVDDWRLPDHGQPVLEGMIPVTSSNVMAIGYLHSPTGGDGDLLVRFLGGDSKHRAGPGALYKYLAVPVSVWNNFKHSASYGKAVWRDLRILGTVSGHQYDYDLIEIGDLQNVPRQAGLKRGQTGEFYIPRNLSGRRSSLPERQVRGARGTIPGWERRSSLRLGRG